MKSSFLAAAMAFLLVGQTVAFGQLKRSYGFKLGAVEANQVWQMSGLPDWGTDAIWGFTAEVFAEIPLLRYLDAVGEIQYTQKGMRYSLPITTEAQPDGTGEYVTESPRVDYISIPLLAKVRLPLRVIVPYVFIGPRFDILITRRGGGLDPIVNRFDEMDYGLTVGGGIEMDSLLPFGILMEFRYNPNIYDSYDNGFLSVSNRSLDFLVGIRL